MNEVKLNLYQKLHEIQKSVKGLGKDKKNSIYDYVSGSKLLSFIRPLMDIHGLLLKQEILSIENVRQDYIVWDKYKKDFKDKSEILSKVMMQFTWIDIDTGDKDVNLFGANGQNDWEKGLGSALTYGERYFLLKYFHISTDEDDVDNPNRKTEPKETSKTESKPPAKAVAKKIVLDDKGFKWLKESGKIKDLELALSGRVMTVPQKEELENILTVLKAQ